MDLVASFFSFYKTQSPRESMASRPSLPFKLSDKLDAPPPAVVMKEDDPHLLSPAIPEGEVLFSSSSFATKKIEKKEEEKKKNYFAPNLPAWQCQHE